MNEHDRTTLDIAVLAVPVSEYLKKHGIISVFLSDSKGVQMNAETFLRVFPEHTVIEYKGEYGTGHMGEAVYNGQKFFALLTEDTLEEMEGKK